MASYSSMKSVPSASRELYWDELTDEQKIEKLGEIIERQNRVLSSLLEKIDLLTSHSHDGNIISVPLRKVEDRCESNSSYSPLNRRP